jgi:transcriptional/translational regulatory protein YebC/TACO1
VICEPGLYAALKQAFDAAGLSAEVHGVIMKALSEVQLAGEDAERMQKIIDLLEGLDDVQEVYTTAVMDEDA